MAVEYFCCYHSYLDIMAELNDTEKGRLFVACLEYSKSGVAPELRGNERFVFPAFRSQIDRDNAKYNEKCRKNSENARQRSIANATNGKRTSTSSAKEKEKEKGKEKENCSIPPVVPPSGRTHPPRFIPPTLAEVQSYVAERHSNVDPQAFIDFYASKGWMVGKTPMKDWKAACRNAEKWERWAPKPGAAAKGPGFPCEDAWGYVDG